MAASDDANNAKENASVLLITSEVGGEASEQSEAEQSSSSQVEHARASDSTGNTSSESIPLRTTDKEVFVGADTAQERTVEAFNDTSVLWCTDNSNDGPQKNVKEPADDERTNASAHTAKLRTIDDNAVHDWKGHVQPEDETVAEVVETIDSKMIEKSQLPVK